MSKPVNIITFASISVSIIIIVALIIFLNQDITPPTETVEKPISHVQN